jgi:hypothetical protein
MIPNEKTPLISSPVKIIIIIKVASDQTSRSIINLQELQGAKEIPHE